MTTRLRQEAALQVLPSLVAEFGLSEAIILNQIHYLAEMGGIQRDGLAWVKRSMASLHRDCFFEIWPLPTLRRLIRKLTQGDNPPLLRSSAFNDTAFDRTLAYAVNPRRVARSDQNDHVEVITPITSSDQPDQIDVITMDTQGGELESTSPPAEATTADLPDVTPRSDQIDHLDVINLITPSDQPDHLFLAEESIPSIAYSPSESVPAPAILPQSGRLTIAGERLRTAYLPRPAPEPAPGSVDPPGEGKPIPPDLIGLYHTHLLHYARPGDYRTLCGQPVSRFETAASGGVAYLDVCKTCARISGEAPAQPHIAIIHAWWESIPDTIRPPGSAPIEPNLRDARDLRDAGITPDQVREFVRATSPGYVKWARWKSKEEHKTISPVIPLSNVKKNIKAFFAPKDESDEQDDESEKRHEPSRPPKPAGLEQIFGK